jgi:ketosteroid isomerase-like protein
LEADSEVTDICERPLLIPNVKPQRVVDFWAQCGGVAIFYILRRPSTGKERDAWVSAYAHFQNWATDNKARVIEVNPDDFQTRRTRYDNWSSILQHLIAHRGQLNDRLFERCEITIRESAMLGNIENEIADVDTMLVRAAVFSLLIRGNLKCDSIDTVPINSSTKVTRV